MALDRSSSRLRAGVALRRPVFSAVSLLGTALVLLLLVPSAAIAKDGPDQGTATAMTHPERDYAGAGLKRLGPASPAGAAAAADLAGGPAGLDVSSYQGNVDWSSVKNNGATFA